MNESDVTECINQTAQTLKIDSEAVNTILQNLIKTPTSSFDISEDVFLHKIAPQLSIRDIINLYSTHKALQAKGDTFWKKLAKLRFDLTSKPKDLTWPQFLLKTEFDRAIKERTIALYEFIKSKSKEKLELTIGKKYINIKTLPYKNLLYKINLETGNLYTRASRKPEFNILKEAYAGIDRVNDEGYISLKRARDTKDLKEYPVIKNYKKGFEVKENYTEAELKKLSKNELIEVYQSKGLTSYGGLNKKELIKAISTGKKKTFKPAEKFNFKVGDELIAHSARFYKLDEVIAGKVIAFTKAGNPKVRLYKKRIEAGYSDPSQNNDYIIFEPELTSEVVTFRYNKNSGYRGYPLTDEPYEIYKDDVGSIDFSKRHLVTRYF